MNALLGEERVLVEPAPGTTMDAIDARWKTPAGEFVLVDTAGIRRQAQFDDQAEFFATMRALQALEGPFATPVVASRFSDALAPSLPSNP